MLGVHVEAGPSTQEIIAAFERCEGWSRDDRKRLAYLAIFTGYIEGRKYSTPTRIFRVVILLMPELGANHGNPLPNNPSPPILAYKGRKGRIFFKEAILSQTRVIEFVQKDIGEMFPKWEFDAEDTPAKNIIKLMFVKRPWKWTMDCWEITEASEEVHTVARSEVTTTVVDAMREGFGTCLKEIKYLSERVEAVEKKAGITTKWKETSSQNTTSPPKPTLEPGID
ncbi:BnaCnng21790D [Brassica napus]|uniref:BnaCnng21790D protein n=1 Tax=Brassica napus TaxID=3708 RepID=A0A078ISR2_BRANA|nr:BnaCnng21790D [Brassica napus]